MRSLLKYHPVPARGFSRTTCKETIFLPDLLPLAPSVPDPIPNYFVP